MLVWPRRWVRRIPPVSPNERSITPRWRIRRPRAHPRRSPYNPSITAVRLGHVGRTHGVQVDQGLRYPFSPTISSDCRASTLAMAVSMIVVVSPTSRHNRAGLHVDGMLGFVRQMRAAIFHRDASGSVQSVFEVFFFRFSSRARPSRVGVSIPEAETRQKRLVALAGVPADDVSRVPERRGVNRGLASSTSRCCTHVKPRSIAPRAQSSNDRAAPRPRPTAESCGPPTSPSRATQSVDAFEVADQLAPG